MKTQEELSAMSVSALREEARALGVRGHSRMRREELLTACQAALGHEVELAAATDGQPSGGSAAVWPEPVSSPVVVEPALSLTEAPFAFPQSYGVDRVVLLVRDPQWMFSYWDTSSETWSRVEQSGMTDPANGWRRVLRLHDMTGSVGSAPCDATHVVDIEVGADTADFYFQIPRPNREYLVEFGYLSSGGEFIRLALSNVVGAPRNAPSEQVDEAWGQLYDDALRLSLAGIASGAGVAGSFPGSVDVSRGLSELLTERISSGPFSAGMVVNSRY